MKIFTQIKDSVYGPEYYHAVLKERPLSSSVTYFFKLISLVAIVASVILTIVIIPKISTLVQDFSSYVTTQYPDNLTVTLDGNHAESNVNVPVAFPLTLGKGNQFKNAENFLVIDTKQPFSLPVYESYKTIVLLTSDSIVARDGETVRVIPLSKMDHTTIDKNSILSLVSKVQSYQYIFIPISLALVFVGAFLVNIGNLFYLLFLALLIWLLLSLIHVHVNYKKAYQIGLHAMTLPILCMALTLIPGISISVPFLFSLITLLIVCINFKNHTQRAEDVV